QQRRAGVRVRLVGDAAAEPGALLHHHLVAALHQRVHDGGDQADAILVVLDLFGDADPHAPASCFGAGAGEDGDGVDVAPAPPITPLPCAPVISTLPLKKAPSASITRGAATSPSRRPLGRISTFSCPCTLPTTLPPMRTLLATMSPCTLPPGPTVTWLSSRTWPSSSPSMTRSLVPLTWPVILAPGAMWVVPAAAAAAAGCCGRRSGVGAGGDDGLAGPAAAGRGSSDSRRKIDIR